MDIQITEHKLALTLIGNIQDEMAKIQDPFGEDIVLYKKYMNLLCDSMEFLNKSIKADSNSAENESIESFRAQLDLLKQLFES